NQLTNLPESLVKLTNLTELDLGGNQLTNLPESLVKLTNLTRLVLYYNRLATLSKSLGNLTNLTGLDLRNNQLTNLPESLGNLTNLTGLDLRNNQLEILPESLGNLTNLTRLALDGNQLATLPESLGNLTNLTRLGLDGNQLTNLPESLGNLTNLTRLGLGGNQLTNLPESLGNLTNLTELDLRNNQLTNLPESLGNLTNLTGLDLSSNQLTTLPESLGNLINLRMLDLSSNQIKKIPSWLAGNELEIEINNQLIYSIECINLSGNPIEEPPLEVVKQGNQAILNYYSQIAAQGKDYLYEAKMLIVGEGGAGKTTLAHKIQDHNCPLPTIDDRTKGITINTHDFLVSAQDKTKNQTFKLNVWDFGGQEIYHYTHRFFLSKRSVYVLVADNRKDNTDFNYWLNIIELFAGDSPIIIVLNEKDDLQRIINTSELRSRYPDSIKEILPVNFKTQEELDRDKRQQRLKQISRLISHIEHCAAHLPHIGEPVPALWVEVRDAVENNDTDNYIYLQQFYQICQDQGITNDQDIATLLGYFHDLGIVLHFDNNPLLRDRVILKPAWATNAVYQIFDNDLIKTKQGRFSRNDCSTLWTDVQYRHMHDVLIELMKNFLLVYEIEQTGNLIAPQMLPKNTPSYDWNDTNNSLMQFRYDLFMPRGILWQFIVLMYPYIKNHD
ncbi:MAG: COR domain-containing protein, partial [Cyanobacteria bacterium P01_A01_bin.40]